MSKTCLTLCVALLGATIFAERVCGVTYCLVVGRYQRSGRRNTQKGRQLFKPPARHDRQGATSLASSWQRPNARAVVEPRDHVLALDMWEKVLSVSGCPSWVVIAIRR
ncbi:hypothetical protein F5144DRAFT_570383 [Chaetomium tenue]|uniref:Uncharacterized protein n=1 Tax=Chaetomium tenue TaxID=1854479 RepID=A0ACB7P5D4_9PEZI|nr:hypothetical protein F5144DRAFT_570383 [Chaetomium globosum]